MTLKNPLRWLSWGIVFPLLILNGWLLLQVADYFKSLVTVFISANLLAFLLDYPVRYLEARRIPRQRAILLVFLLALSFFIILGITLVPAAIAQLNEFLNRLPIWIESGVEQLQMFQQWTVMRRLPIDLDRLVIQLQDNLSAQLQLLGGQVLGFSLGLLSSVFDLLLTIALTFYLLTHGDRVWDGVLRQLPSLLRRRLRRSVQQNFQNYFIGQATLASLTGLIIIIALLILQVPFGLLFGLTIGFMALFPFGTGLGISLVSFLVALQSFWLGLKVLLVATVIDQSIQNGIAPRLLGRVTGLNPVWVLVSLLIGVRVGGVLGLLVAVPTAGVLKSLLSGESGDRPVLHPEKTS